jgi:hypothetical protein
MVEGEGERAPSFLEGGGLRLDVLDVSIASTLRRGGAGRYTASQGGGLARAAERWFASLERRVRLPGVHAGQGLIAQRDHSDFSAIQEELLETPELVPSERLDQLENPQVVLREPGLKQPDVAASIQMEECTPQFFLRNVQRVQRSYEMIGSVFKVEVWRDAADYNLGEQKIDLLNYAPPVFEEEWMSDIAADECRKQRAILRELDWGAYHGRWKEGVDSMSFFRRFNFLFETERVKGRFEEQGDADEAARLAREESRRAQEAAKELAQRDAEKVGEAAVQPNLAPVDDKWKNVPEHIRKMLGMM